MADQSPENQIIKRIIEVDRKIAAQLYDVWSDMKEQIKKDIEKTNDQRKKQPTQETAANSTASK